MRTMGTQATRATDAARRAGIPFELHEYAHEARSTLREGGRGYALEAVEVLGLDPDRVYKTIVVSVDGRLGLAVVPASSEVDLKATADALGGRKAAIAQPADAERATGYVLGGISPLGQRQASPTVIDGSALGLRSMLVSGGKRGLDIELAPAELIRLTSAVTANIGTNTP